MNRREFITFAGAVVVGWPVVAIGQISGRVQQISVLMTLAADDQEAQVRLKAFREALHDLGWRDGHNVRIEYRWSAGDPNGLRVHAKELAGSAPDVILAISPPVVAALRRETNTLPIVFVQVSDPVGLGFVASLPHPGGNITGVSHFDFTIGGKWLEVLKEIAPRIARVAIIYSPDNPSWRGYVRAIEGIAASIKLETTSTGVRNAAEIGRALADFARKAGGGLIVLPSPTTAIHRKEIVAAAERHGLPAVYPFKYFITSGGLISYGIDTIEVYRRAASYVDKILKGSKPAELAVEGPTKFEMVINLKTAKALGLSVPPTLLTLANDIIE